MNVLVCINMLTCLQEMHDACWTPQSVVQLERFNDQGQPRWTAPFIPTNPHHLPPSLPPLLLSLSSSINALLSAHTVNYPQRAAMMLITLLKEAKNSTNLHLPSLTIPWILTFCIHYIIVSFSWLPQICLNQGHLCWYSICGWRKVDYWAYEDGCFNCYSSYYIACYHTFQTAIA